MFPSVCLKLSLVAELLEISPNIYSGRKNPVWSIAKPVDATKAAHFSKLVTLLMKLVSISYFCITDMYLKR